MDLRYTISKVYSIFNPTLSLLVFKKVQYNSTAFGFWKIYNRTKPNRTVKFETRGKRNDRLIYINYYSYEPIHSIRFEHLINEFGEQEGILNNNNRQYVYNIDNT